MKMLSGIRDRMHENDEFEVRAGKALLVLGAATALLRKVRHHRRGLLPLGMMAGGSYALVSGMRDRRAHRKHAVS